MSKKNHTPTLANYRKQKRFVMIFAASLVLIIAFWQVFSFDKLKRVLEVFIDIDEFFGQWQVIAVLIVFFSFVIYYYIDRLSKQLLYFIAILTSWVFALSLLFLIMTNPLVWCRLDDNNTFKQIIEQYYDADNMYIAKKDNDLSDTIQKGDILKPNNEIKQAQNNIKDVNFDVIEEEEKEIYYDYYNDYIYNNLDSMSFRQQLKYK